MREKRCGYTLLIKYKKIKDIIDLGLNDEDIIKGIVEDVQFVEKDMLFLARKGKSYNGFEDVDEAINKKAIVIHEDPLFLKGHYIQDLHLKLHELLDVFYANEHYPFKIIGVCGSNGKSSVVSCLYQMLNDYRCMRIGTHLIESRMTKYNSMNTTPNIITLMHALQIAKQEKIQYVIMEVSSHAIDQKRIQYLTFDYLIYTNIARDHLDYHKTLIHYRYTKYKLMKYLKPNGYVIVNKDELYYQELKKMCKHTIITYGCDCAHFQISDIQLSLSGSSFYINRFYYHTKLLSKVNIYNLSAVVALLRLLGVSYYSIYKRMLQVTSSEGRLQLIYDKDLYVFLDYAHTANAMCEVLNFFKQNCLHQLIIVVGCGGNREKEKREEVGYYASYFCDYCIFTEDNSRDEDVKDIMQDMKKRASDNVKCIADRKEALEYAVNIAQKDDIILVSGKGNEKTLTRKEEEIHFDDREVLLAILGEKVWK